MNGNGERRGSVTVGDLMSPDPIVVRVDEPLAHAAHLMEEHEIHGLPVVEADGALVGVISQADLVRVRATQEGTDRWSGLAVRESMASPVITAEPSMTIRDAAALMETCHVHRLVVVDEEQRRPVGVISTTDLVRLMSQETADV